MLEDPRQALFDCLEQAVAEGVFPGCVALVWADGAERYHEAHGVFATHPKAPMRGQRVARDTVYDLASLTKVLATTTLAAIAVGEGRVALDDPLPREWAAACPGARLGDLLSHSAGLEAHREYFAAFAGRAPVGPRPILDAVVATPPAARPGERAVYSDLGFILLGAWLERLFDGELDRVFENRIAWPLGLERRPVSRLGYHRLGVVRGPTAAEEGWVAPTEVYDPKLHDGEAPSYFPVRRGARCAHYEVHDDNAFVMGGVAGHAGLFGDAEAVAEIARAWLECALPGLTPALRERFWRRSSVEGSTRCLGWDGVSPDGGSTGGVLSSATIGHLGYTGCSLWIDPPTARIFVLLSNRVHPRRQSAAISGLRPRFHRLASRLT
ncbi:MAG: beta-lactamase family protein [Myxococcales bacterium]|nr:beta-lactamase family protein [Myxococcales bacterium]